MDQYSTVMQTLCLSDIPLAGQQVLAKHSDPRVRAMLAANQTTDIGITNMLVTDMDEGVRLNALTRTTDSNSLAEALSDNAWTEVRNDHIKDLTVAAVRNPNVPPELLVAALDDERTSIAVAAYCNPNTPFEARQKLQPQQATRLLESGMDAYLKSMKTFDLVANNPWMWETPRRWDVGIRYAIGYQPDACLKTLETLREMEDVDPNLATNHPNYRIPRFRHETQPTVSALLATSEQTSPWRERTSVAGTTAAVLTAIARAEFTLADADCILNRKVERPRHPSVFSRLVGRYGIGTLAAGTTTMEAWGQPVFDGSAKWSTPAVSYLNYNDLGTNADYRSIPEICAILGNNPGHWEAFVSLANSWHGNIVEAAKTACKL